MSGYPRPTMIHICLVRDTSNNYITRVTGLDPDVDLANIMSRIRVDLQCNGSLSYSLEDDFCIHVIGDYRVAIREWLFKNHIVDPRDGRVTTHGY